jgi:hypothetical protein
MNKKIICIGIISMFLLTSCASISASSLTKDKNLIKCSENLRLRAGKFYANGDVVFTVDPDYQGNKTIPHGSDVTIYCEYENVDTLAPAEYWEFEFEVSSSGANSGHFEEIKSVEFFDDLGPDDSHEGTLEITVPLDRFINGAEEMHFSAKGWRKFPMFNITDWCSEYGCCAFTLTNNPPNKPFTPEGAIEIKYQSRQDQEYTVEVPDDPDGDPIVEYEWWLDRERDDFEINTKTDEPSVEIDFPENLQGIKEPYYLKVRVKDNYLTWSTWSTALEITAMPKKSRNQHMSLVLHGILERSNLFPLLKHFFEVI